MAGTTNDEKRTVGAINIQGLAEKLAAAFPPLDDRERGLAVQLYRELAQGSPVAVATLAGAARLPADEVEGILASWPGVFRDPDGAVVGFWGLALPEMAHRLEVDGQVLSTWCAWDSLFIPEILGKTARVRSRCPATGAEITLMVGPSGVRELSPRSAVVSFLAPESRFDSDVLLSFCHFVHFFSSADAGASWTVEHPGTFLLSVDEAFSLGRRVNAARLPDLARPLFAGRFTARPSCCG